MFALQVCFFLSILPFFRKTFSMLLLLHVLITVTSCSLCVLYVICLYLCCVSKFVRTHSTFFRVHHFYVFYLKHFPIYKQDCNGLATDWPLTVYSRVHTILAIFASNQSCLSHFYPYLDPTCNMQIYIIFKPVSLTSALLPN